VCNMRKVGNYNIYTAIYAHSKAASILTVVFISFHFLVCCGLSSRLGQGGYKGKVPAAEEMQNDVETPEPELEDSGRRLRNRRGKPGRLHYLVRPSIWIDKNCVGVYSHVDIYEIPLLV
jgi:hypothetical protein